MVAKESEVCTRGPCPLVHVYRGLATTTDTCPFMFLFFMTPEELGS